MHIIHTRTCANTEINPSQKSLAHKWFRLPPSMLCEHFHQPNSWRPVATWSNVVHVAFQVNIIMSNEIIQTPDAPPTSSDASCYSQQLVTLTPPNKAHLTEFIDDLQADPDTQYIPAFTTAFQLFQQTPVKEHNRGKHDVYMDLQTHYACTMSMFNDIT